MISLVINLLYQSNRIHAICVCDDAEYFYNFVDDHFKKLGLTETNGLAINVKDVVDIVDGHKGRGYALSTSEELSMYFKYHVMFSSIFAKELALLYAELPLLFLGMLILKSFVCLSL